MLTKKQKRRVWALGLLGGLGLVGAATAIPLTVNQNQTQTGFVDARNGTMSSAHLQFTATDVAVRQQAATSTITPTTAKAHYESVLTTDGTKHELYVSPEVTNDRKLMPILSNPDGANGTMQADMRSFRQILNGEYPGWSKTENADGSRTYVPTATLRSAHPEVASEIKAYRVYDDASEAAIAKIKELQPTFVEFIGLKQADISFLSDKLADLTFIKKLTFQGTFDAFVGVKLPASVVELEFLNGWANTDGNSLVRIDPLLIPDGASIISDAGSSSYAEIIDLSHGHENLTKEEFQKAVDKVYKTYVKSRLFQGPFTGGYIYSWDLRNTGFTSFNDVTVPPLNDGTGRFYVDSVDVSSSGTSTTVDKTVGSEASNDSRIGRIYDWNTDGWAKVQTMKVSSKDGTPVPFEVAVAELAGFLRRYPNLTSVDLSGLKFKEADKSASALVEKIKADLAGSGLGDYVKTIKFTADGKTLS